MSETPYIKNEANEVLLPFQEGTIPIVALIPIAGGLNVSLVGNALSTLNAIASDIAAIETFLSEETTTAKFPHIVQRNLLLKDTQYSFIIPANTKKYSIRNRGLATEAVTDNVGTIRYAYQPNLVANALFDGVNSFGILNPRDALIEEGLHLFQDTTIYFASDTNDVPLTIEYWT